MTAANVAWSALTFKPVGQCIYCGSTDDLRKEHIIPFALNGRLVLPEASCPACEAITGPFEQKVLRNLLGQFRVGLGLRTRNPRQRPDRLPAQLVSQGNVIAEDLPASEHPAPFPLIHLGLPKAISGLEEQSGRVTFATFRAPPGDVAQGSVNVHWNSYFRFLAKVAHSFYVAMVGVDGFEPLLNDLILGKDSRLPIFVGGDPDKRVTADGHKFDLCIENHGDKDYCVVRVTFYADWNLAEGVHAPTNYILVGHPNRHTADRVASMPFY